MLKLYSELADWWPLLSRPEDYADEADLFGHIFAEARMPADPTLLELGCGGGNNALYLKRRFAHVTLTDISPQMLAVSRAQNPDCDHQQGDMRSLRLGRAFDAVFIHDAIEYMTTPEDLSQAIATAYVHCKPGGVALFAPDQVRETFQPSTDHGGHDGAGRSLRYLEWVYDPGDADTTYVMEFVYILHEDGRPSQVEHDLHICGMFPRAAWVRLLQKTGFQPTIVVDLYGRDLFVARRPSE